MTIILRMQNLPWSASSADIRKFFVGVSIPDGGVHIVGGELGDVFIAFSTDEDARQAFGMTNKPLCGSKVTLMLSSKNEMMEVIAKSRAAAQKDVFSSPASASASQASAAVPDHRSTTVPDHRSTASSSYGYWESQQLNQGSRANDPHSGRQPLMSTPSSRPMDSGYGGYEYGNQQYGGSQGYGEQPNGGQSYGSRQANEPLTGAGGSVANTPAASEGYSGRMSVPSGQPKDPYAPGGEALGGQPVPGRSAEPQEEPPKRERSRWDQDPTQWQRGLSRWDNESREKATSGRGDVNTSRFGGRDVQAQERDRSRERDTSKDREHVRERDRDRDVRERQRNQGIDERVREDRPSSRQSSQSSGIHGLDSALEAVRQPLADTASNPDSPFDRLNKKAPLLDSPLLDKANPSLAAQPESKQGIQPQMYGQADQAYNSQRSLGWQQNLDRQGPSVGQTAAESSGFNREQPQNGRSSRWGPPKDISDPNLGKPSDTPGSSAAQYQMDPTSGPENSSRRPEHGARQPFDQRVYSKESGRAEGYRMDQEQPFEKQPPWLTSDRDRNQYGMREMDKQFERPENQGQPYDRSDENKRLPYDRSDDRWPAPQRPEDYREFQMNRPRSLLGNPPLDREESGRRQPLLSNPDEATKEPGLNRPKSLLDMPDIHPTKTMPTYDQLETAGSSAGPRGREPGYDQERSSGRLVGEQPFDEKPGLLGQRPSDKQRDPGFDDRDRQENLPFERSGRLSDQPPDRYMQNRGDRQDGPDSGYFGRDDDFRNNRGKFRNDQQYDDPYWQRESGGQIDHGRRGLLMTPEGGRFGEPAAPQGGFDPGHPRKKDSPDDEFISMAWPPTEEQEESEGNHNRSRQAPLLGDAPGIPHGGMDERDRPSERSQYDMDRRGPPHPMNRREPPLGVDNRGMPFDMDRYGPGDMDRHERYDMGRGGPQHMENQGSRYDLDRSGHLYNADRFGAPQDMDQTGFPPDIDRRGPLHDTDGRGSRFDMDRPGPLRDTDRWGPPHDIDRREQTQNMDGQVPPHDTDRRSGPLPDIDGRDRLQNEDMYRRGAPNQIGMHESQFDMDRLGEPAPQDMNRLGSMYDMERGGPPQDMDSRDRHDTDNRRPPPQEIGKQALLPTLEAQGQLSDRALGNVPSDTDKQKLSADSNLDDKKDENCVRLTGLPFQTSFRNIIDFFPGVRIPRDGIKLGKDNPDLPNGEAFVKFASKRDCSEALKHHKEFIGRRYIQVVPCLEEEWSSGRPGQVNKPSSSSPATQRSQSPSKSGGRSPPRRGRSPPRSGSNRSRSPRSRSRGRSPLRSRGASPGRNNRGYTGRGRRSRSRSPIRDSTSCLELKGLPSDVKERDIIDFFRGISIVPNSIFIECAEDGKPKGNAYARLANQRDMRLALEKDGRSIGRRRISVRDIATKIMQVKVGEIQRIARVAALKEKKQQQESKTPPKVEKKLQQTPLKSSAKEQPKIQPKNQQNQKTTSKMDEGSKKSLPASNQKQQQKPPQPNSSEKPKPLLSLPVNPEKQKQQQPKQPQQQPKQQQPKQQQQQPPPSQQQKQQTPQQQKPPQQKQQQQNQQKKKEGLLPLPTPPQQAPSDPGPVSGVGDQGPPKESSDVNARTCIHVRNLPYHVSENEVLHFFRDLDIIPPGLVFMLNPDGSPSGHAYMALISNAEANKAAERRQGLIRGRKIVISIVPRYAMLQAIGLGHTIPQESQGGGPQGGGPQGPGSQSPGPQESGPQGPGPQGPGPQGPGPQGPGPQGPGPQGPGPQGPGFQGPGPGASGSPSGPLGARSTPPKTSASGNQPPLIPPLIPESPQSPDGRHPIPLPPLGVMVDQRRIVEATNLPFDVSVAGVVEFFQKYNVIPESVRFKNGPGGRPTGAAIAAFVTPKDAQKAIDDLSNKAVVGRTGSSRAVRLHLLKHL